MGGTIHDVKVKTTSCSAEISISDQELPPGVVGEIIFKPTSHEPEYPVQFEIQYLTNMNETGKKAFLVRTSSSVPTETR
jgi:hypothetical protein